MIPGVSFSHQGSVFHQPLLKPCTTAGVWRTRDCLNRSTRCLRFRRQSSEQDFVFISLICVCLFPKRICSSNRMCATRHFIRGRTLGPPLRRAACKKARQDSEERREHQSPPLCGKEQDWGQFHGSGASEGASVIKIGGTYEGWAFGWFVSESFPAFLCSDKFKPRFLSEPCAQLIPYPLSLPCLATPKMSTSLMLTSLVLPALIFSSPYLCPKTSCKVPDRDPGRSLALYHVLFGLHTPLLSPHGNHWQEPRVSLRGNRCFLVCQSPYHSLLFPNPGGGQMSVFVKMHRLLFYFVFSVHLLYFSFRSFLMNQKAESWFPCANPMQ